MLPTWAERNVEILNVTSGVSLGRVTNEFWELKLQLKTRGISVP
jgi:hypothetical protein